MAKRLNSLVAANVDEVVRLAFVAVHPPTVPLKVESV